MRAFGLMCWPGHNPSDSEQSLVSAPAVDCRYGAHTYYAHVGAPAISAIQERTVTAVAERQVILTRNHATGIGLHRHARSRVEVRVPLSLKRLLVIIPSSSELVLSLRNRL